MKLRLSLVLTSISIASAAGFIKPLHALWTGVMAKVSQAESNIGELASALNCSLEKEKE
ncbi:hypothetical protein GE107_15710 [Cohnella sp. CFH 77786]|uniref:hypothetical protein n=1 Tax=Cohnella sp. CFH 77786 TaxID=2662265 RepID=UPI001C60F9AB|nr:hypothetical protein [Cohnella sp. CFH 77786]MBW5447504.1 hypothetical protein [Cohnella sp. CFH 77786]